MGLLHEMKEIAENMATVVKLKTSKKTISDHIRIYIAGQTCWSLVWHFN